MYTLHFYGRMIADAPRMDAYAAALQRAVNPDSVVLDLGSGPGALALLACKLGARRVYAVEPDNAINIAREAATANGFADRLEFFQNVSTDITLPEPASIIVSDLRGVLPWFQQHIPSIIDARTRLLARGGLLIPQRDILWAAVVETPERYEEIVGPWRKFDLSAALRFVTNTWRKTRIEPDELLVEPLRWTTLDYSEIDTPDLKTEISWRIARSGAAHGVALWFDSELIDGIGFSNHPRGPELIYGQGFFPFSQPIEVNEGDHVDLRLSADLVRDDYVWRWDADFKDQAGRLKVSFRQSTFFGVPLSAEQLRKEYAQHS